MPSSSVALLDKHRTLWPGRAVVLNASAPAARLPAELLFADAREHAQAGRGRLGLSWNEHVDVAIVQLPKGTRRRDLFLAQAASVATRVIVVGDKSEGIKPAERVLAQLGSVAGRAQGRKRRLLAVDVDVQTPVCLEAWETRAQVGDIEIVALPGVFAETALSRGSIDDGTALLLQALPPTRGRVLDIGCGAGPLGTMLAARGAEVTMTDVDAFATESARRTLAANGLQAEVVLCDLYEETMGRFDLIVTNPPFHRGVGTEYATTEALVREAPRWLQPNGELWLVANRFLPWRRPLDETFADVSVVQDDGRFVVLRARTPR